MSMSSDDYYRRDCDILLPLLNDLENYVKKSLPTHLDRGGDADRQELLKRLKKAIDSI